MKKEQLRKELLKRGSNGRTLRNLYYETGLEFFNVPFHDVEYAGRIVVKVEEGMLEIPYRMVDMDGSFEEFVMGAEEMIADDRLQQIQDIYTSQQAHFISFCQPVQKKTVDYIALADTLLIKYQSKRVHYKDVWSLLEIESMCKGVEEDVLDAIEVYLRYNLSDFSLKDKDIDHAKEILKNAS